MHVYHHGPTKPSTNGAPQTVAAGFFALIFFMLLFPMARVWVDGNGDSRILLQVLHTNAGFNVFALLLLLAPLAGIAVAMLFQSAWRIASALVAIVAAILIPLTLMLLSHEMHDMIGGAAHVAPGMASYILLVGYLILAITSGVATLRSR